MLAPMMAASNCVFCKIVAGTIPSFRVFEDAATLAFLDINPVNPGHTLVIPRNHAPSLMASDERDLAAVMATARRVAAAIERTLSPHGMNLLQANGPGAAQSVLHFHLHVIPRVAGDELKMNWTPRPDDKDRLPALAEDIRKHL